MEVALVTGTFSDMLSDAALNVIAGRYIATCDALLSQVITRGFPLNLNSQSPHMCCAIGVSVPKLDDTTHLSVRHRHLQEDIALYFKIAGHACCMSLTALAGGMFVV